jgi:anti-sigma B factor antagonist
MSITSIALAWVRWSGGELKLVYLTKKIQDLLQMTRLYTVFEIFDDETAALNSFDKSAASTAS